MQSHKPKILVIDDGTAYADVVENRMPEFELIKPDPASAALCLPDGPAALDFLDKRRRDVDVVLLDMHFDVADDRLISLIPKVSPRRTKRFQGVAILREIRKKYPQLPVVLLTAVADLSLVDAAEELTCQSMTYILDSDDLDALRVRINEAIKETATLMEDGNILWGTDTAMRAIRRRLEVVSRGKMPLILEGETGTGKSFLAERFVHIHSNRKGPFVVLDLATLPSELISAHLFGATKGAYTGAHADRKGVFELAHGGTLFIDEIQNVPLEVQKQLLLVLQDRKVRPLGSSHEVMVDVKVVAASNQPLEQAVASGKFRPDLYMRLSPATKIKIPNLSERPADLLFFANRFVQRAADDADVRDLIDEIGQALGKTKGGPLGLTVGKNSHLNGNDDLGLSLILPGPVWKMMEAHLWPGNMRELEMVVHNIVTFTLVAMVDAIRSGVQISSSKFQVDTGLVGELLSGSIGLGLSDTGPVQAVAADDDEVTVRLEKAGTLNAVANGIERQCFLEMFRRCRGDFSVMAKRLLGDPEKGRAVRLRFNQLGLKVRELSKQ